MARLVLLLLGVEYLRGRWRSLMSMGILWLISGVAVFVDGLDDAINFPIAFFAWLLLIDGCFTLAVAWAGVGGQKTLRYVKGTVVVICAVLILASDYHGHFILSMLFGFLFLADGLLQLTSAWVVRYRRWRAAAIGGMIEILLAIFFFQPYPTNYHGTLPYFLGLFLFFAGLNFVRIALNVRRMMVNPGFVAMGNPIIGPKLLGKENDKTPVVLDSHSTSVKALTVHIWTPMGSSKAPARRQMIVDRYIAAVDTNGVISTGHSALESPEGIYISLYPKEEIDRSSHSFTRLLRATPENNVAGRFLPDYQTEAKEWCPSNIQVMIKNYNAEKLSEFWQLYRQDDTYNLTYRNCSSTVSRALDAAIEGAVARSMGFGPLVMLRLLLTPELWVASQIRMRALTMAWTPGLTLDYARALSMLVDPRQVSWLRLAKHACHRIKSLKKEWRREDAAAKNS
ncbi:HdeD family acid-resistance protein [Rouxiella badensis]|uniref:HdeD family acid-resistance protein n=1 Tax=Rouxiella badensis TaxID=1646377 RepID=UPI00178851E7|nr:DUF308 domain-containing protein [Rouxiella badensis]QOI55083.1 DUF308 domain-containing protein [Rouxiella badensis subsp. acadiensis]